MIERSRVALKEWEAICRELAEGCQVITLRKGGLGDQKKTFSVEHHNFFLFPTYVHQNKDELVDRARAALTRAPEAVEPGGMLRLELYATAEIVTEVRDLETLRALAGQQALSWEAIERRFHYRRPGLHVIALRVYRLPQPLAVPYLHRYDGCRSWVMLESELPVSGAQPVLDDHAFAGRVAALRHVLTRAPSAQTAGHGFA
jgi:hypothetical protein